MDAHPLEKKPPTGGQPSGMPSQMSLEQARAMLMEQVKRSANWYYIIGGLSILNSIIFLLGTGISFVVGLAYTQFVDGMAQGAVEAGVPSFMAIGIGMFVNVMIAGVFALFGYFGRNGARWAFILGMILYAVDGLIFLAFGEILSVLFHGFALFNLFRGVQALGNVEKVDRQLKSLMPY